MLKAIKPCEKTFALRFLVHDIFKIVLALPGLLWFRPKIIYENERAKKKIKGGALVIANHLGFFDPIYLQYCIWYRRHHFVCLEEFFKGCFGIMFKLFLCIPINKRNVSVAAFKEIVAHLKSNELVSIFPEGQVEKADGEMGAFKSGMILMAIQSKKPIVPVYIHKRAHFYNRLVMCVGEPVDTETLCGSRPDMKEINRAAKLLQEKETTLSLLE